MKNKEFKLLIESWKSNFIVEANDEDDHEYLNNSQKNRFDSGSAEGDKNTAAYADFARDSNDYDNLSQEENILDKEQKTEELCRRLGIPKEELESHLISLCLSLEVDPLTGEDFTGDEEVH